MGSLTKPGLIFNSAWNICIFLSSWISVTFSLPERKVRVSTYAHPDSDTKRHTRQHYDEYIHRVERIPGTIKLLRLKLWSLMIRLQLSALTLRILPLQGPPLLMISDGGKFDPTKAKSAIQTRVKRESCNRSISSGDVAIFWYSRLPQLLGEPMIRVPPKNCVFGTIGCEQRTAETITRGAPFDKQWSRGHFIRLFRQRKTHNWYKKHTLDRFGLQSRKSRKQSGKKTRLPSAP